MAAPTPIRILMLHGYTQTGPLFHAKTRALEKSLHKAFPPPKYALSLHYPTAPHRLHPSNIPNPAALGLPPSSDAPDDAPDAYGWWIRKTVDGVYVYSGLDAGLAHIADALRADGPFDGAIGFSQGAALAGMLASLLEPGRPAAFERAQARGGMPYPSCFVGLQQPPLKFAVSYSGFAAAENPEYQAFSEPRIRTPMLHFLGSVDTVVEEGRSLKLVEACEEGKGKDGERLVYHPGGHFLPSSQKQFVGVLVGFIREMMDGASAEHEEEQGKAEDMDMPF